MFEMAITVDNSNDLVNLMLDKMSKFGINYKVSKHNGGPKQGVIPAIDIETVEKTIAELESKAENNPDLEIMQYLMNLYENVNKIFININIFRLLNIILLLIIRDMSTILKKFMLL
jgi:hypothetical protein